jgi:LacI family transcriptional regulator
MKFVLLAIDPNIGINQQIGIGLATELQKHGAWHVRVQTPAIPLIRFEEYLRDTGPEVVVGRNLTPSMEALLKERDIPLISLAHKLHNPVYGEKDPQFIVNPDEEAIGNMAAEYLLAQGFEHFACVAFNPDNPGPRMLAFASAIEKLDKSLGAYYFRDYYSADQSATIFRYREHLHKWLHGLPRPCAVFAHSDSAAAYIVTTCLRTGLRVPDDISVLGVDDNPLYCKAVLPNLASVSVSYQQIGIEAARIILDPPDGNERVVINVAPSMVVERASCRSPQQGDPVVEKALEYIRTRVEEGVRVSDLQAITGLSPHQLVYRFNQVTGFSPIDMILHHRIARAKQLLMETSDPIASIASRSGFNSPSRFCLTFRDHVGMSPRDYRKGFKQKTKA